MSGAILHWDFENAPVPRGGCVSSVLGEMRRLIHDKYGALLSGYVYVDPQSLSALRRQEIAANGLDIIDCPHAAAKINTVDFRIVTRALAEPARPTPSRPAAVIVTGDGDFCYTISTLRNVGVKTQLIFDSDRRSVVNSTLLQVAECVHGISFQGNEPDPDGVLVAAVATAGAPAVATAVAPLDLALDDMQTALMLAIERAPQADDDGFRTVPAVCELFQRLRNAREETKALRKAAFRRARSALVDSGLVEARIGDDNTSLLRLCKR